MFRYDSVISYLRRPFADLDEMEHFLIDQWNSVVLPGDEVWVIGNFTDRVSGLQVLGELNGTKVLVPGALDPCWPHKWASRRTARRTLREGFRRITTPQTRVQIHEVNVEVSHLPYRSEYRCPSKFAPLDEGRWLLHGSVHGDWRVRARQINVGVDAWEGRPVPEDEVWRIMNTPGDRSALGWRTRFEPDPYTPDPKGAA